MGLRTVSVVCAMALLPLCEARPAAADVASIGSQHADRAMTRRSDRDGCKPLRGARRARREAVPLGLRFALDLQPALDTPASTWKRTITDPAHSTLHVQNTGAAPAQIEWVSLNGRQVLGSMSHIQQEIDAIPPEADGSSATQVFRFVADNRQHGFPLTTSFEWYLTPTLFFNSVGVALCGEAAEEVNMLATDRGLLAREWKLNGHLVAEIQSAGRWQMYDADYGVYFLNREGQIASLAELEIDPSLITDPELRLPITQPWNPYQPAYANLFSTTNDNSIRRIVPRVTLPPRPLDVTLPRGASLRFPGHFAVRPPDYLGQPAFDYADLLLRLPAGDSGVIGNPFLLHTIRGNGVVSLEGQTFSIGSAALQDAIDARIGPMEEMELLEATSAVEVIYLVNPKRWSLGTSNTLVLRKSVGASLAVTVKPTGNPAGDSDNDFVPDDGDGSGIVGDAPCPHGETSSCDDSCVAHANGSQLDGDADGIGNACDGDFDQDELVTNTDLLVLEACRAGGAPPAEDPDCAESDLNEDGVVGSPDRVVFDRLQGIPPTSGGCGLGPELALALPLLARLRRRGSAARAGALAECLHERSSEQCTDQRRRRPGVRDLLRSGRGCTRSCRRHARSADLELDTRPRGSGSLGAAGAEHRCGGGAGRVGLAQRPHHLPHAVGDPGRDRRDSARGGRQRGDPGLPVRDEQSPARLPDDHPLRLAVDADAVLQLRRFRAVRRSVGGSEHAGDGPRSPGPRMDAQWPPGCGDRERRPVADVRRRLRCVLPEPRGTDRQPRRARSPTRA